MPDTLSREEIAAIREEHGNENMGCDAVRLLAHIDALTAADKTQYGWGQQDARDALAVQVAGLRVKGYDPANVGWNGAIAAVLAIVGEPDGS